MSGEAELNGQNLDETGASETQENSSQGNNIVDEMNEGMNKDSSDDEDDEDDFGNFSDASFEEEESGYEEKVTSNNAPELNIQEQIDQCLDNLFGKSQDQSTDNNRHTNDDKITLQDLIKDERPHVIYEQLFNGRIQTSPFIWKRSHIRSTLLQILGIEEDNNNVNSGSVNKKQEPLDDSLFIKLCHIIDTDKQNNNGNSMILRDNFKYEYQPRFHKPGSSQEEQGQQEDELIPGLLTTDIEKISTMDRSEFLKYHDQLCQAIDSQVVKMKTLNKCQDDLTHDKVTFENVVTNLSGHTQRLQRDEIALYNKKMGRKVSRTPSTSHHKDSNQWKRFSWVGL